MSLDLKNIIRRVLSEQINPLLQQLKDKYVGDGKTISEKDFQKIDYEMCGTKLNFDG